MDIRSLKQRIQSRSTLVGIMGLGYVGLPLAHTFLKAGFRVLGFDVDKTKIDSIQNGESYLSTLPSDYISSFVEEGKLETTTDFNRLAEPDFIIICVPTPLTGAREPDMSFIVSTAEEIQSRLRRGQTIVLESTTYPGTTDTVLLDILKKSGLEPGQDFCLGFSPEREDPGNANFNTSTIPKVVSGLTSTCAEIVTLLYGQAITKIVTVSTTRVAEMTKLVENIYRSVNIALVNELKMLCHRMDIDVHEVLDAAATKPFGFQKFTPGPGLGGHCIPIDPFYLTWKARQYDFSTRFIELAGEINAGMPYYVVQRVMEGLNRQKKSLAGSAVLVLGIAYKKNIDDMRESPALKIMELLQSHGAIINYHDPFFETIPKTRNYSFDMRSVPLEPEHIKAADCVLIVTDHTAINYGLVLDHAQLVVDSRNVMKNILDIEQKVFPA